MAEIDPSDLGSTLDADGPVVLKLKKVDQETRTTLSHRRPLLLIESNSSVLSDVVEALRPRIETLIDRLIRAPDLTLGDDLQHVLDLGLYNPRLGCLFETLWIARFEHAEHRDASPSVRELLRTTFEDPSPLIRNDAVLFWLTLLRQNDAATGQVILLLTSTAGFDPDLLAFIRAAEHWAELGSPVRIVLDWPIAS